MSDDTKVLIPKLDPKELARRAGNIRQVQLFGNTLWYVQREGLGKVADGKRPQRACKARGIETLAELLTWHNWGFKGFTGPSAEEILSQIPVEHLDEVVAYEAICRFNEQVRDGEHLYFRSLIKLYSNA